MIKIPKVECENCKKDVLGKIGFCIDLGVVGLGDGGWLNWEKRGEGSGRRKATIELRKRGRKEN